MPHTDYRVVREKLATQNSHSTQSLSCLLAKTRTSHQIAGDGDAEGLYSSKGCGLWVWSYYNF